MTKRSRLDKSARRRRRKAIRETVSGCVSWIGFLLMLGSAGGSDLGTMCAGECLIWILAGFTIMVGGLYFANAFYWQGNKAEWRRKHRKECDE